jgi:hypothetical protein
MNKGKLILLALFFLTYFLKVDAQSLLKYETQVISITSIEATSGGIISIPAHISIDKGRFVYQNNVGFGIPSNPKSFELNDGVPVNSKYSQNSSISISQAIQLISTSMNNLGYSLKSTVETRTKTNQQLDAISLIFEKSTSYREEELYKLLGELNTKIDTTSKNYIEKAKTEINQNVLQYLNGIPDEVLAKSFKEQLLKNLSIEIDDKLKKMKEEILLELKKP